VFPKQPSQPFSAEMQSISSSQAMGMTSVVSVSGTTPSGQFSSISQVQAALKCKLPGCVKPCYVESNGKAHDFCSKAHAISYEKQKQPLLMPSTGPSMPDGMLM